MGSRIQPLSIDLADAPDIEVIGDEPTTFQPVDLPHEPAPRRPAPDPRFSPSAFRRVGLTAPRRSIGRSRERRPGACRTSGSRRSRSSASARSPGSRSSSDDPHEQEQPDAVDAAPEAAR
jgi:hypothetical protein